MRDPFELEPSQLENPDLLTALLASRSQLVDRMDYARGQPYAALYKVYLEVQEKIHALAPPKTEDTPVDEFSDRLARKRARGA